MISQHHPLGSPLCVQTNHKHVTSPSKLESKEKTHRLKLTTKPAYTTFEYTDLAIDGAPTSGPATGAIIPGGRADLWETVATVTATVANSGEAAGAEVAQLYVGFPESAGTPPRQLRGFSKLPLEAGASDVATFALRRRDLSVWDVAAQEWVVPAGEFNVTVGASSRDLRLAATLIVA